MDVLQESFNTSVNIINNLKIRPDNAELLNIYKYYKQANFGNINSEEPNKLYFKENAKWQAWNSIKGMNKEIAMQNYINLSINLYKKNN